MKKLCSIVLGWLIILISTAKADDTILIVDFHPDMDSTAETVSAILDSQGIPYIIQNELSGTEMPTWLMLISAIKELTGAPLLDSVQLQAIRNVLSSETVRGVITIGVPWTMIRLPTLPWFGFDGFTAETFPITELHGDGFLEGMTFVYPEPGATECIANPEEWNVILHGNNNPICAFRGCWAEVNGYQAVNLNIDPALIKPGGNTADDLIMGCLGNVGYPVTGVEEETPGVPLECTLWNYPNPFNATTNIAYYLPMSGNVSLSIYNPLGQRVATLANGLVEAGQHSVTWDATGFSSGIYSYQLTAGEKTTTKRMTLVK